MSSMLYALRNICTVLQYRKPTLYTEYLPGRDISHRRRNRCVDPAQLGEIYLGIDTYKIHDKQNSNICYD